MCALAFLSWDLQAEYRKTKKILLSPQTSTNWQGAEDKMASDHYCTPSAAEVLLQCTFAQYEHFTHNHQKAPHRKDHSATVKGDQSSYKNSSLVTPEHLQSPEALWWTSLPEQRGRRFTPTYLTLLTSTEMQAPNLHCWKGAAPDLGFKVQEVCNKQGFQATPPLLLSSPSPEPLICSLSQESVFVAGRGNVLEKNNPTKHLFITHLTLKSRSDPGSPFLCGCTTVAPQCASGWCSHILLPLIPAFGTQVTPVPHIPNHQLFQW